MNDTAEQERGTRSAEQTRLALIRAGLSQFGVKGFEATSTRELAREANANIGSIAYHFGGKDGLREACARHVVETIGSIAGPVLSSRPRPATREEARDLLRMVLRTMVSFIVAQPEAGEIARFVVRELSQSSSTLDILYGGILEPVHRQICEVWEVATGQPAESEDALLSVFSLLGQVIYFRIGREVVLRRMGWKTIGPEEAERIIEVTSYGLDALLFARAADHDKTQGRDPS